MHPVLFALLLAAGPQAGNVISGIVQDATGAPVPAAVVRLQSDGRTVHELQTGTDGRFAFPGTITRAEQIVVSAPGFAPVSHPVPDSGELDIVITLEPAPFFEAVNVTSSRGDVPRADPTVTVTVVPSTELLNSAPVSIDDALKAIPGFTLFRRTSSRVSNPTAQGVALRGIGGTGSSRSLVLADGVPLNDAFGGWVYWDKVPQAAIDRIEVQRGSGSDLYGADAAGGVVQILTARPGRPTARAVVEGGNMGTGRVSLFAGSRTNGLMYSAGGQWFTTDGYIPVATTQDPGIAPRGPIDSKLASAHRSGIAALGYQASNGWHADVSGGVFDEDRLNGTPAVINDTASRQLTVESSGSLGGGILSGRGFGGSQTYDQTFSAVNATRTSESLNRVQRVPTKMLGFGGQWIRPLRRHVLLVGAETRHIEGTTIETPYTAQGVAQATTRAGGTQRLESGFAQVTLNISQQLTVVAGAHGDGWHTESSTSGYNKTLGSFNPRASFVYRIGGGDVAIRGSAYRGFRAPTLNEFYRGFRVGNTQTNPNEALLPERLAGGDAGVLINRGRASSRITAYWNVLDDAITNVTLSITPALITKQRANADTVHATGVEVEEEVKLPHTVTASFAAGFVNSRFKGHSPLRNNRVPQVAKYNLAATIRYAERGWSASSQVRVTGPQFEDDQNLFTLRRATVVDVYVGRYLRRQVQAFVAAENLFDSTYDVGRTPILTTGLPRAVRAGIQLAIP